jgi:3'(2'), 5'-bisphosphate nucleotidase
MSATRLLFHREREAALAAVVKASHLVRRVQESLTSQETLQKRDRTPVTVADYAAQAVIIQSLTEHFPDYPFIAEESSGELREEGKEEIRGRLLELVRAVLPSVQDEAALFAVIDKGKSCQQKDNQEPKSPSGLWWTLDPIDGTLGFLRREQYAIALALMQDNHPVLGVLGCPALPHNIADASSPVGCVLVAVKGQGCFMRSMEESAKEETKVSVSNVVDSTHANFTESVEASHSSHDISQRIARELGVTMAPVRMDSQCKYAIVARGDASIYLRLSSGYVENIWDHAAGTLIVEEAGGEVTDLDGKPLDWSHGKKLTHNKGVVATNGKLHKTVLAAIKVSGQ